MRLLLSQGKRKTSSGWLHFRCPMCPLRGLGVDPSFHLGVKVGTRTVKCFRCGADRLPTGWNIEGQPPKAANREYRLMPKPKTDWEPGRTPAVPCPWTEGWQSAYARGARPVRTPRGDALMFTFPDTEGYQIRFFDGGSPKVRAYGLRGPQWLWPGEPRQTAKAFFVVEGWSDGLALRDRSTLALLGASTVKAFGSFLSPSSGLVPILFLDRDEAGRKAQASIARILLQRGWREVGWMTPPPGKKDPGDMTAQEVDEMSIYWVTDLKTLNACRERDENGAQETA